MNFLKRFFKGEKPATPSKDPSIPEDLRVYAIGDIHGRIDLLEKIHEIIREDAKTAPTSMAINIIYLGDYVDRGIYSKEVLDLLTSKPFPEFKVVYLLGNHDQKMLRFLNADDPDASWLELGGNTTVYSYGVRVPKDILATKRLHHIQTNLHERMPDTHFRFLEKLELSFTLGDYFFSHAGIDPSQRIDKQKPQDLLWGNKKFLDSEDNFGKIVVHGHTVEKEVIVRNNRICIDTGAFQTNILTCLVIEGENVRFLSTDPYH